MHPETADQQLPVCRMYHLRTRILSELDQLSIIYQNAPLYLGRPQQRHGMSAEGPWKACRLSLPARLIGSTVKL